MGMTEYLTADEVAAEIGLEPGTLALWRQKKTGPTYVRMTAKVIRYRRADVDAWLESCVVEADAS